MPDHPLNVPFSQPQCTSADGIPLDITKAVTGEVPMFWGPNQWFEPTTIVRSNEYFRPSGFTEVGLTVPRVARFSYTLGNIAEFMHQGAYFFNPWILDPEPYTTNEVGPADYPPGGDAALVQQRFVTYNLYDNYDYGKVAKDLRLYYPPGYMHAQFGTVLSNRWLDALMPGKGFRGADGIARSHNNSFVGTNVLSIKVVTNPLVCFEINYDGINFAFEWLYRTVEVEKYLNKTVAYWNAVKHNFPSFRCVVYFDPVVATKYLFPWEHNYGIPPDLLSRTVTYLQDVCSKLEGFEYGGTCTDDVGFFTPTVDAFFDQ